MRYLAALLLVLMMCSGAALAAPRDRHNKRGLPRTEEGLVNNFVGCLQNKDSTGYYNLFIPFDTLWHIVLHNTDHTPGAAAALNELREHPQTLLEFDPHFNREIIHRFNMVLQKGEDSGIHWGAVVLQRYELKKQPITNTRLAAYERLAPERFQGYLFIRDMLGRTNYCVSITEIQKVNGYFYGGQVLNMLEATTVDEFLVKEVAERQYLAWLAAHPPADSAATDSAKTDSARTNTEAAKKDPLGITKEEDEDRHVKREVVDRKYYEGKFDDEIPVKLYVRYKKEPGINKPVSYDGLYKFGDQLKYVKLEITRTADGKWMMEDNVPIGILEVTLKNRTFTGIWTNSDENGYDVVMTQAGIPQKKVEALDNILDKGLSGRIDEESFENPSDTSKSPDSTAAHKSTKAREKKKKKKDDEEDDDKDAAAKKDPYLKAAAKEARRRKRREMDE